MRRTMIALLVTLACVIGANTGANAQGVTVNPITALTRPNNTTAYTQNNLVASNTVAASVVVPAFQGVRSANGGGLLRRFRLIASQTSGAGSATFNVEFWSCAPTFANGDGGAYSVSTGAACWVGSCQISSMTQVGDGAYGVCIPTVGTDLDLQLTTDRRVWWSLQVSNSAGFTPTANETFTGVAEILADQ